MAAEPPEGASLPLPSSRDPSRLPNGPLAPCLPPIAWFRSPFLPYYHSNVLHYPYALNLRSSGRRAFWLRSLRHGSLLSPPWNTQRRLLQGLEKISHASPL